MTGPSPACRQSEVAALTGPLADRLIPNRDLRETFFQLRGPALRLNSAVVAMPEQESCHIDALRQSVPHRSCNTHEVGPKQPFHVLVPPTARK